jgi:hypothetical protein
LTPGCQSRTELDSKTKKGRVRPEADTARCFGHASPINSAARQAASIMNLHPNYESVNSPSNASAAPPLTVYAQAALYTQAALSVIPILRDGTKRPALAARFEHGETPR